MFFLRSFHNVTNFSKILGCKVGTWLVGAFVGGTGMEVDCWLIVAGVVIWVEGEGKCEGVSVNEDVPLRLGAEDGVVPKLLVG